MTKTHKYAEFSAKRDGSASVWWTHTAANGQHPLGRLNGALNRGAPFLVTFDGATFLVPQRTVNVAGSDWTRHFWVRILGMEADAKR